MRLRTKLILSYVLVVFIAVIASGALALPLLQDYQKKRYDAEVLRMVRFQADLLGQTLNRIIASDPDKALFKDALPNKNVQPNIWPKDPPPIDQVRGAIAHQAQLSNLRLLIVRPRGRLVLVDTEPEQAKSLLGFSFPVKESLNVPTPVPASSHLPTSVSSPTSTPVPDNVQVVNNTAYLFDQLNLPNDPNPYYIVVRRLQGVPNLFGLNNSGRPEVMFYAVIFPAPAQPNVWEDMLWNLSLAGLAALLVSLVAGLLLARGISRPLVRLTKASKALAKGDYSHTVPPEGSYELVQLAESFNRMSDEVEAYQRMQRELIGNVSHELKTPLTTILGFSQAMLDGALRRPEDFASSAEIIHRETERMIRLVHSLLDLSKLESGQIRMARRELDLTEVLERVVLGFGPRAEAAQVALLRQLEALPPMLGDADRLQQVFSNLVDNALKYTAIGGEVKVTCRSSGSDIVVNVSDSGVGIPEEDLRHIFERFYQANKARSREIEGVGLGLAISREIVLAHGGKIEAQSRPGKGTRFIVMLPGLAASWVKDKDQAELLEVKTLVSKV